MKLSETLYAQVQDIWPRYLSHPFVTEMAHGTLPKEKFRYYMLQDYLYLQDYVKIFAAMIQKAEDFEQIRFLCGEMSATIDETFRTHLPYMKRLGIGEQEIACATAHIDSNSEIFLVTKQGMCIRFQETDVRATGRASMGVIGMNLSPGDEIIGMQLQTQGSDLLIVSENGMGKRTNMDEFTVQKRGGKGVKCYKIVEKTGDVVGAKAVNDDNEIMMITTEGIIIQLRVQDISTLSRITSGVKLINLDNGVKVAQIAKVREKLSNGDHEFDNLEEAMEEVAQEAVSEDEDEAEENLIFPTEDSEDDE